MSAVMKSFDAGMNSARKDLLNTDENLLFLHCNAHYLLGLVTATDKVFKAGCGEDRAPMGRETIAKFQRSSRGEHPVTRFIREACACLGPRGDDKFGCRESWLAYCMLQRKSEITSFRGNRFNNLFEASAALHLHRSDITNFFEQYFPSKLNWKQEGTLEDAKSDAVDNHVVALGLFFVSALREGDFPLYIQSLERMVPWFFALDCHNYAKWLSIHINDMKGIMSGDSGCLYEFMNAHFVLQKTKRPFSKLALDQAHEQNNAIIKGEGGAVGLTENPSALRRWLIGGPEIARVIAEFESSLGRTWAESETHHEQRPGFQEDFKNGVSELVRVIQEAGNPFQERSTEFVTLHSNNFVDTAVHESLQSLHELGCKQYQEFVSERLITQTKKMSDPITRNNMMISGAKRKRKSTSYRLLSLKSDCRLFSRLYIACQMRRGGLDNFFTYENQRTPPSLSCDGMLRTTTKSDLLQCHELLQIEHVETAPDVDVLLLDGAAVVNMLRPGPARTFGTYATDVFAPYIVRSLQGVKRLDIVCDVYRPDSVKSMARENRGVGKRKRVTAATVIPSNWAGFLRVDGNKTQFFLAQSVLAIPTVKLIVTTQGPIILANQPIDQTDLAPCSHEEADTRLMVHLVDGAKDRKRFLIRTVDTDVVVLAVSLASRHPDIEIWVAMGTGKAFRYITVHDLACGLGAEKAGCLPMFHAFTGCDTVSAFTGIGKNSVGNLACVSRGYKHFSTSNVPNI